MRRQLRDGFISVLGALLICAPFYKSGIVLKPARVPLLAQMLMPIVGGGGSTASWTALTYTCAAHASTSPQTCTWSTTVPSGASVFCSVENFNHAGVVFTVTDSNSNSYTAEGSVYENPSSNNYYIQNFHFFNIPTSITTSQVSATGTINNMTIECNAATGGTGASLDGQCQGFNGTTPASGNTSCSAPIVTTAKDYVFCGGYTTGGNVLSIGSGFTAGSVGQANNILAQYLIQSSAGSITPTFSTVVTSLTSLVCSAYIP